MNLKAVIKLRDFESSFKMTNRATRWIELQDESSCKMNRAARWWIKLQDGESSLRIELANQAIWTQLIALLGHHSIEPWSLLVVMFIMQDVITKAKNKSESFMWSFRNLFGERCFNWLWINSLTVYHVGFFSCTDTLERVCSAFVTMRLGSQEEKSMTQHLTKGDIDDSSCMNMAICDIPPYTVIWRVWCPHSMIVQTNS